MENSDYQLFLLRMRRMGGGTRWIVSVQEVDSGTLHNFASLPALLRFLAARMEQPGDDQDGKSQAEKEPE